MVEARFGRELLGQTREDEVVGFGIIDLMAGPLCTGIDTEESDTCAKFGVERVTGEGYVRARRLAHYIIRRQLLFKYKGSFFRCFGF